jgi:hypothetical protein
VDSVILCNSKESLLDAMKDKLNNLVSSGIAISHATIDKDKSGEDEVENMSKQIATLKNQSRTL